MTEILELIEHRDETGTIWKIERLEESMLLYHEDREDPLVEFSRGDFDMYCTLRRFIKGSTTEIVLGFITDELEGVENKKLGTADSPPES